MRSLDVGCGFDRRVHKKRGDVGLDLYRGICDVVGDVHFLPFRNEIFDKVFVYAILEHLDDPLKGLREAWRVAKNGGHFEVTLPVESRSYMWDIRHVVLEFPLGLIRPLKRMWRSFGWGWRKKSGTYHKNRIQPVHIARYLKVERVEILQGVHYWFKGRKGKLLRRLFGRVMFLDIESSYFIEAVKDLEPQNEA